MTTEQYSAVPMEDVIRKVNEVVRGWVGYFRYGNCTKALTTLKRYPVYRIRICLRRKHHYRSFGYKACPDRYYFDSFRSIRSSNQGSLVSVGEIIRMKNIGKPCAGESHARLCVQRRLVCSAGVKPARVKARAL
ncbi:MAG: hypothetical protein NTW12_14715 [Deltaproteobacteria bacterium]|nr:hypothetical protein [Deltaproteobacteria bacterium]